MSQPENTQWQSLMALLQHASQQGVQEQLLQLLLTPDERSALVTRVQIVAELLRGEISQRDLKDRLNTGIATITRGSNSLKMINPEFKRWLESALLNKP